MLPRVAEYFKKEYGLTDTRGRYYAKDETETLVKWAQFQINGHLLGSEQLESISLQTQCCSQSHTNTLMHINRTVGIPVVIFECVLRINEQLFAIPHYIYL